MATLRSTVATCFRRSSICTLQSTLDAVQVMPIEENRFNALKAVFSQLMADATLTPLFNYHYRISAPPGVNGVRLTPRGWFEFTEAWLPAPSQ